MLAVGRRGRGWEKREGVGARNSEAAVEVAEAVATTARKGGTAFLGIFQHTALIGEVDDVSGLLLAAD